MKNCVIIENGRARFIHDDDLAQAMSQHGDVQIRRASHVEPNEHGKWTVDLTPVGGPKIGTFDRREMALECERLWLLRNKF